MRDSFLSTFKFLNWHRDLSHMTFMKMAIKKQLQDE